MLNETVRSPGERRASWRDTAVPSTLGHQRFESYVDVVRHWAREDGDALAVQALDELRTPRSAYTYAEADLRIRSVAAHLQATRACGQRALLVLDNDPAYLFAFLACIYAGVVAVPLNVPSHRKHAERLAIVARDCDARFIVTSAGIAARYRDAIAAADGPDLEWVLIDEVASDRAAQWREVSPRRHDLAYLQYTSGSTGSPRGVEITHGNLLYQGAYMQRLFGFTRDDRALSWLPMFHDMGLVLGALQPFYTGFPVAIARPSALAKHPGRWLRAISDHRITFSGGPNFVFDLAVDALDGEDLSGLDLSCWQVALNAAEPIRAATVERFTRRLAPFGFRPEAMTPAYGLAEATLALTIKPRGEPVGLRTVSAEALGRGHAAAPRADEATRTLVGCGVSVPDTRIRIVAPDTGLSLPADAVGEVWAAAAGDGMPGAYWRQAEASEATFGARTPGDPDRHLRTGDLGFLDGDGRLFITGRCKDVLIVAGKNHYPQDIEETVEGVDPAIRGHFSAVVAVGEDDGRILALAEVRHDARAGVRDADLRRRIRAEVADVHGVSLSGVVLLRQGQLPMTTSGKIQRRQARDLYLAGALEIHEDAAVHGSGA